MSLFVRYNLTHIEPNLMTVDKEFSKNCFLIGINNNGIYSILKC